LYSVHANREQLLELFAAYLDAVVALVPVVAPMSTAAASSELDRRARAEVVEAQAGQFRGAIENATHFFREIAADIDKTNFFREIAADGGLPADAKNADAREAFEKWKEAFEKCARSTLQLPLERPLSISTVIARGWDLIGSLAIGGFLRSYIAERAHAAYDGPTDETPGLDDFAVQNAVDTMWLASEAPALRKLLRELFEDDWELGYARLPNEIARHLREAFSAIEHGEYRPLFVTKRAPTVGFPFSTWELRRVAIEATYALQGLGYQPGVALEKVSDAFGQGFRRGRSTDRRERRSGTSSEAVRQWINRIKKEYPERDFPAEWQEIKKFHRRRSARSSDSILSDVRSILGDVRRAGKSARQLADVSKGSAPPFPQEGSAPPFPPKQQRKRRRPTTSP
jgi:hypothetical protein